MLPMMRHVRLCNACNWWLQDLPAMCMSQGHIMAAEWVSYVGVCGDTRDVQLQLLTIVPGSKYAIQRFVWRLRYRTTGGTC